MNVQICLKWHSKMLYSLFLPLDNTKYFFKHNITDLLKSLPKNSKHKYLDFFLDRCKCKSVRLVQRHIQRTITITVRSYFTIYLVWSSQQSRTALFVCFVFLTHSPKTVHKNRARFHCFSLQSSGQEWKRSRLEIMSWAPSWRSKTSWSLLWSTSLETQSLSIITLSVCVLC